MTFPKADHPLYCVGSGTQARPWPGGCPRCGRVVATKESMAGKDDSRGSRTLLPHLRYRWAVADIRVTARRSGVEFIAEPRGHCGTSKKLPWQVVRVGREPEYSEVVAVHATREAAFTDMDSRNGWLVPA